MKSVRTLDLDLLEYDEATRLQMGLVETISMGGQEATVFCRHPRIVTVGRATKPSDLSGWSGRIAETSRGGRATYHGPGQIVLYPILDLRRAHRDFPARDLRTAQAGERSQTGVWVGERKIASIGIAVRKWTTYHGCAINVERDSEAFLGINPCGYQSSIMTSVEEILGEPHREALLQSLIRRSESSFAETDVGISNGMEAVN
jgi:lipoyl(octanoyl) transferase